MKASKILAVRDNTSGPAAPVMGITVENVSYAEVNEAWKIADRDQASEWADRWQKTARVVVGIPRATLETSAPTRSSPTPRIVKARRSAR